MKSSLSLLALFFSLLGFATGVRADTVPTSGPEATIILPSDPTRVEKFAGAELAKYLAAATGCQARVINGAAGSTNGPVFWVGNMTEEGRLDHDRFPLARLGDAQLIDDGICIDGSPQQTLLVGKGERGALNAVYTYLERAVGCQWPEPGRDSIPHVDNWQPPQLRLVVNPQFFWRGIANHGRYASKEFFLVWADWMAKNRMNSFQLFPEIYEPMRPFVIDAILDRGLMANIGGHSREFFLSSKKYQTEHPNWFATENGRHTDQVDYNNYDSVPTYAESVVAFVKKYPEVKIASLWPVDGFGFGELKLSKGGNATDVLLAYVNKVAEGVHAEVPDLKFEFLAYVMYTAAPLITKPEPYVIPTFCEHYGRPAPIGSRDHWRPISDNSASNKTLRDELKKWIGMSSEVTEFSYYGDDCIKRFLYHPVADVMVGDCHYYHSIGLAGNFVLFTNPQSWWSHAVTAYAYAQAAFDGDLTQDQIEDNYYKATYGPAAQAMHQHAIDLIAIYDVSPLAMDPLGHNDLGAMDAKGKNYEELLQQYADVVAKANKDLDDALAVAPDDWVKARISKLRAATEYLDLWYQIQCGEAELTKTRSSALKAHVLDLMDKYLKNEVIAKDDAEAINTAHTVLNAAKKRVTDLVCDRP
jgi:hypothetical protein